jgi:hypothetical protein
MSIYDEVLSFIEAPRKESFEALALEVFRYQFSHVAPYREYCVQRGVTSGAVHSLDQIPAISTVAFKYARLESSEAPSSAARLFLTSGTTVGKDGRGRHMVVRPEIYRVSALTHLRRMLFPDGARMPILALHPTADRMPESSLSQMISWCIEEFGTSPNLCAATGYGIETAAAIEFLNEMQRRGAPVCILGTTASFAALFEAMRMQRIVLQLPSGSRLMDTGGAKGQITPLSAEAMVSASELMLGIPAPFVINEYGMTEMCSQLYDATIFNSSDDSAPDRRIKLPPPWLRAVALDPVSIEPVDEGAIGLLSFFDLANVGSVCALMTEDFGVIENGEVRVLGRAAAGGPRGCALAIEEFAERDAARGAR